MFEVCKALATVFCGADKETNGLLVEERVFLFDNISFGVQGHARSFLSHAISQ
jgi:hypothetical protein